MRRGQGMVRSMTTQMPYRVDLDFVGLGGAGAAYGGYLKAWSYRDIDGKSWFSEFREAALLAVGRKFLPIYRMADGEYRFLMGRRFNASRPRLREIAAIVAERLLVKNPNKWKTSWGEGYPAQDRRSLRNKLIEDIRYLSHCGYLACYINDNGLNAFTEYNVVIERFFESRGIPFGVGTYVPFHFAPSLLIAPGWQDFISGRCILVVTGIYPEKEILIRSTLKKMGAREVLFIPISSSSSMTDVVNLSVLPGQIDICLVAAGIGSARILRQLEPLQTLAIDVGGLMNCFVDPKVRQHGGVIGLPVIR